MKQSFLCGNCKRVMCNDCREIAEEYQELLDARIYALASAVSELETTQAEVARLKRRAEMYEECAKAGVGDIIAAWMDKEIGRILKVNA